MTNFGYTLMTEQSRPKDLVSWAVGVEDSGFDFEVCSDPYSRGDVRRRGFTEVALVQIGGDHEREFLDAAAGPLLEKLRQLG